eukprot:Hpha_TRINITY_DN16412_c0_g1::TRINITY_DN16412_c0_g1_i1::g.158874::m.158874/K18669/DYRK2_3_4; dual specificity tyrosine-phosphorylation-regulated kinase 2/3/4
MPLGHHSVPHAPGAPPNADRVPIFNPRKAKLQGGFPLDLSKVAGSSGAPLSGGRQASTRRLGGAQQTALTARQPYQGIDYASRRSRSGNAREALRRLGADSYLDPPSTVHRSPRDAFSGSEQAIAAARIALGLAPRPPVATEIRTGGTSAAAAPTRAGSAHRRTDTSAPPPRSGTAGSQRRSASETARFGAKTGPGVMTPEQALVAYESQLRGFERAEILEYPEIYYVGPPRPELGNRSARSIDPESGYFDDERGDYKVSNGDQIGYRFEVMGMLGKGSFGQVLKCRDHRRGTLCAVKMIRNKKRFHRQAQIEVRILKHLKENDKEGRYNIISMQEHLNFRSHVCMVFDLHSVNLYEFIKMNKFQPLNLNLVRRFAHQLLIALNFLHKEKIIHCDLKPENILLKQPTKAQIKLIDFGSSCFEDERLYSYMQSRFYRAPEVILGIPYARPIDMWSFGCIMCELATGYPIFPGENEHEQLLCIMEVMGQPPARMVQSAPRKKQFFEFDGAPRIVANSKGRKRRPGAKNLKDSLRVNDDMFENFVRGFLEWEPDKRTRPDQAMHHPWLRELIGNPAPPQAAAADEASAPGYLPRIHH